MSTVTIEQIVPTVQIIPASDLRRGDFVRYDDGVVGTVTHLMTLKRGDVRIKTTASWGAYEYIPGTDRVEVIRIDWKGLTL